ncbi:MAG TPA: alpha/beta hydrolase, partial [Bacteroidales bacterium]|nr:alpha/beta hydrolase [Bacteroidales bacterium]
FHLNLMDTLLQLHPENMESFSEADHALADDFPEKRLRGFLLKNITKTESGLEWKINLEALKNNLPEIMEGFYADDFAENKIKIPTLFLRGEKSGYIPLEDFKFIRYIFPYSEIISIPDAGHWLHAEQPKLFIKNVRYFLNQKS